MVKIKICGLSEIEHVLAAAKAGADFLGLVFAPSRRHISPEKALLLVEALYSQNIHPTIVGVFANAPADEVNRIAEYCRLNWVQLSGDETWGYCREIKRPTIKAIHISATNTPREIIIEIEEGRELHLKQGLIFLLDSPVGNTYGGTGQAFNWQLAKEVSSKFPVIIAGGLTPLNVKQLIKEAHPWGIDVSTGVESNGQKDTVKIKAFITAVRKAEKNFSRYLEP